MHFRDTLTTLLPPPRDDEPASLRQDIIDELGDHLACAYPRELLRGADSSAARRRVLERFGDPAAVARRLWFDAMKGKIMAQRVVIVTCLVVMLACLSLVGLVWLQSSRAAAQAAEAERKLAEALAQAQITNKDMLNKLGEMSDAIRNPRSPDWNPVKFVITEDTPNEAPVAGCSVSLFLAPNNTVRVTDASGVADFGLVHPGEYSFQVSTTWDQRTLLGSGSVQVEPGSQVLKRLVCPRKATERVPLRVQCNWPADLEKERLLLNAPFHLMPLEKDGTSWNVETHATRSVLCGPGTALREILDPDALYLWATSSPPQLRADVLTCDLRAINGSAESLKWERGTYYFSELIVLRPSESSADKAGRERFEVIVRCYPAPDNLGTYEGTHDFLQEPPTDDQLRDRIRFKGGHEQTSVKGLGLPIETWSRAVKFFEARPDHVNEWRITLPEELIKAVREKLKGTRRGAATPSNVPTVRSSD